MLSDERLEMHRSLRAVIYNQDPAVSETLLPRNNGGSSQKGIFGKKW